MCAHVLPRDPDAPRDSNALRAHVLPRDPDAPRDSNALRALNARLRFCSCEKVKKEPAEKEPAEKEQPAEKVCAPAWKEFSFDNDENTHEEQLEEQLNMIEDAINREEKPPRILFSGNFKQPGQPGKYAAKVQVLKCIPEMGFKRIKSYSYEYKCFWEDESETTLHICDKKTFKREIMACA
jgi:hypothetical protein